MADVAGEYVVQLIVNDGIEDSGSDQVAITAQTLQEATGDVVSQVDGLVISGVLGEGQGNSLQAKLKVAIQSLSLGNENAAINKLKAFVYQINAFIYSGILTQEEGQLLIDAAYRVINELY